jgi:carbonic anhydrase
MDLIAGYQRFRATAWPERKKLFEQLADRGQAPQTMVIACSDSRVDPGMIFDAAPGEIFVVRNVANLVPPFQPDGTYHGTSAALEFAVLGLQVRQVIVLGHAMCGGVRALFEGIPPPLGDFVGPWIGLAARILDHVRDASPDDPQLAGEQASVRLSLDNLRTFPWIAEREADGRLHLLGAHFDIRSGVLALLQPDGNFVPAT